MSRKKSAMSIALVISLVLGLVILVVVGYIFNQESRRSALTLEDCRSRGGSCEAPLQTGEVCKKNYREIPNVNCPTSGDICCIQIK